jgi:hypothetical protein
MNLPNYQILDVTDPQKYYYAVWGYSASHSLMAVRAIKESSETRQIFYMIFETVQYFEGPMRWEGCFRVGNADECLRLLRSVKGFNNISEDYLLSKFRLFQTIVLGQVEVKIVAQNAYILKSEDVAPFSSWWPLPPTD